MQESKSSFNLTPHKIALCFLLHEALTNPILHVDKQTALLKYIISEVAVFTFGVSILNASLFSL